MNKVIKPDHSKSPSLLKNKFPDLIFLGLFLFSLSLRLVFVLYNRESNDDHIQVVQLMLASSRLPTQSDCRECFQPKIFTFTVAKVVQLFGLTSLNPIGLAFVAEIINMFAGLITMAVAWLLIVQLPIRNKWLKVLAFGLVALNPTLIGINSQATNDAFAILFSTLAIYTTYVFLQRQRITSFLLIILFACLGIATKTNAWVTAIAITITLFIQAFLKSDGKRKNISFAIIFLIAIPFLTIIDPLTQYIANYEKYGKPVMMNKDTLPFPPLNGKNVYNDRGGITSIRDSFLTLKFLNLLEHPRLEYVHDNYPPSRTSFWAMIYASGNSASFQNYPPSWSTNGTQGFWLRRGIFILALIPTLLLFMGVAMETFILLEGVFTRDDAIGQSTSYGLFVLILVGYFFFEVLYSLSYQSFLILKAIFIFPAILTFPSFFLRAGESLYKRFSKHIRWIPSFINTSLVLLLILYAADIVSLILRIRMS
jgi:hypothetical protein